MRRLILAALDRWWVPARPHRRLDALVGWWVVRHPPERRPATWQAHPMACPECGNAGPLVDGSLMCRPCMSAKVQVVAAQYDLAVAERAYLALIQDGVDDDEARVIVRSLTAHQRRILAAGRRWV